MTKKQELSILDHTITALGPDSYLGPWLSRVRAEVEGNLRCDILPEVLPTKESLTFYTARSAGSEQQTTRQLTHAEFNAKYNQLD